MIPYVIEIGFPELGGGVGIVAASIYAAREFNTWYSARKSSDLAEDKQEVEKTSAAVTDAATANSILLRLNETLKAEGERKDKRIEHLESRNAEKDAKIEELQGTVRELRAQVHILLQRLDGVDFELDDLRDKH